MAATENPPVPFSLTLFGPMQALVDGRPLPRMRSRKGMWLLALLTLRPNRSVEREWLAGTLWPDMDQSQAFANLRPILSELRNGLGSQKERLQSPDRHTLLLDLSGAQVDLLAFDAAIADKKLSALQQAVALYQGPLLEGCNEEWVYQERNVREQSCLQALQQLGDTALAAGDYATATGHFQRALHLDPWWEAARRGGMEALARSGDTNAALRIYREFIDVLKNDPHAAPDEQTTALYTRLRAEARQRGGARADIVTEPAPLPKVIGYLPHALTDLVGREDERLEVAIRLRRSRLVTLTGMGGIGKTRLALEVAREVSMEYADGVWLVALETLSEGNQVLPQIASVLGVKEEPGRTWQDQLTRHLHTKRLLLVLDNCEHLLAATAHISVHLLRECSQIRILATSREALAITGETTWAVPSLATPDPEHLPSGQATLLRVLMGYEGVQLFAERAQAVQKTFLLNGNNARAVAEVCFRLEGIPLAIELAAARINVLTAEQIAARLDNSLMMLTGRSRSAQSRQQTLRATLDWSYALLSEQERVLLCRLSVFVGGCTLEAAEQICDGNGIEAFRVLDLLTSLAEKSLIVCEERAGEVGRRYRLLEMVRQYASEALRASGASNEIRIKHRRWLVALAEEADLQLNSQEQERGLNRLEREHDNLRATLKADLRDIEGEDSALRLAGALWRFWDIRGYYSEGRYHLRQALERPEAQEETAARAKALTGEAALSYRQGDYAEARERHQQSLQIFLKLGNRRASAASLANQGTVAFSQGDYAAARTLLEESLSIQRELDNRVGMAQTLQSLSHLLERRGEYAEAERCAEESLSLHRELKNPRGIALALDVVTTLATIRGDYAAARLVSEESLNLRREIGDRSGIAISLGTLGELAQGEGDSASARLLFEEALLSFRELGDRQRIALALATLGILAQEEGDYARAKTLLQESLVILRQLESPEIMAFALAGLGAVAGEEGDHAAARTLLKESLTIYHSIGSKVEVSANLEQLAIVWQAQGQVEKAVQMWGAADALRESLGTSPLKMREKIERRREEARSVLGEATFGAAWQEGKTLSYEQAVIYALRD